MHFYSTLELFIRKFSARLFLLLLFILFSCIYEFDPRIENSAPKLAIDGLITNQPGPYKVTLRYSTPFVNDNSVFRSFEDNAIVSVTDDLGNETQFHFNRYGEYLTDPSFIGQIGRSYVLTVKLPDGNTYQSLPEVLNPVPSIDTIYTTYQELSGTFLRGEFNVLMDFKDDESTNDYYQWDWTHYRYEPYCYITNPPKDGSDYEHGLFLANECCGDCWSIDQCNSCINIFSDKYSNGRTVTGLPVLKIPYDSKEPYFVQVRLKSLTESAYNFWQSVLEQTGNSGGIFDKPPITIQGNIINPDNLDEQVLGYFGASSIFMKPVYISRSNIPESPYGILNPRYNLLPGCIECLVGAYRTDQTPAGW